MLDACVQKIYTYQFDQDFHIFYGWIARSTDNPVQSARGTPLANGHRHAGKLCSSTIDARRREFLYRHQLLRVLVGAQGISTPLNSLKGLGWIDVLY